MRPICEALLFTIFRKNNSDGLGWVEAGCVSVSAVNSHAHRDAFRCFFLWNDIPWAQRKGPIRREDSCSGSLSNGTCVVLLKSYWSVNLKPAISSFLFKFLLNYFYWKGSNTCCILAHIEPPSENSLFISGFIFFSFVALLRNLTLCRPQWIVKILNLCKYC